MEEDFKFDNEEQVIDRCDCCENWVRRSATRAVMVGQRADEERWCVGCIQEVDGYTLSLLSPDEEMPPPDINL